MSQMLPLGGSKWIDETPRSNENFIKSYNDDTDEGYFLEIDIQFRMKIEKL